MVMSVPNSEHGPLPTTLEIRRLWGSPDVTYGRPSEMERENTETSWSPPTSAPTPDACGVACGTSLAIKEEIAVMISLPPLYLMTSTPFTQGLRQPTPFLPQNWPRTETTTLCPCMWLTLCEDSQGCTLGSAPGPLE